LFVLESKGGPSLVLWAYDGAGNRTQQISNISGTNTTHNYTYTASTNRLAELRNAANTLVRSFVYDAAGRATTDNRVGSAAFTYTYDATGRMSQLKKGGVVTADYAYDALGHRIKRQVYGTGALSRFYLYSPEGLPIAETNGTGVTLREYIWLEGRLIGVTTGTGSTSVLYFVHGGHLGQPMKMTNAAKAVVWDADVEAFGQATISTNTVPNEIRHPDQLARSTRRPFSQRPASTTSPSADHTTPRPSRTPLRSSPS
jgi:YD repeat-containing protein